MVSNWLTGVLETSLAEQGLSYNLKEGKMFFSAWEIIAQIQAYIGKVQKWTFPTWKEDSQWDETTR